MNPGRAELLAGYLANPPGKLERTGRSIATMWCPKCKVVRAINETTCTCLSPLERREWPVSQLEDRIIGQFEDEVRRRAVRTYQAMRRVDAAEAERMETRFLEDMNADAYNWEDQGANQVNHVKAALKRTWGAIYIVYLLLHRCDGSIDEKLAAQVWNANMVDGMRTWLWAAGLQLADPNALAPLLVEASGEKSDQVPTNSTNPTTRQQQLEAELEELRKQTTSKSEGASGSSTSASCGGPTSGAEATFPM